MTPNQIAGSELAMGDAIRVSMGPLGDKVVTGIGVISLAAIVNLQVMAASRITYRMAADGVLPRFLSRVAKGGAPQLSVAAVAIVSGIFAGSGSYESITRIYAPWSIGSIFMICVSGIALRYREPDLPRPYLTPLFPWLSIFAALIQASLIAIVVLDDPASGLWSLVVLVAPLPLYLYFTRKRAAVP
jgi:APA family basic amino acid/polyamine antiporter